jgi:hypothetical protein
MLRGKSYSRDPVSGGEISIKFIYIYLQINFSRQATMHTDCRNYKFPGLHARCSFSRSMGHSCCLAHGYAQDFHLPGKGDGNSALSWLPESEVRLHSYAGCCKRYTPSATEFSSGVGCRLSPQEDSTPREGFLREWRGLTRRGQGWLPLLARRALGAGFVSR